MIIDLHCDTVYRLWKEKSRESLDENSFSVDAKRMKEGGVSGQCFALFTPMNASAPDDGLDGWGRLCVLHDRFVSEIERSKLLSAIKGREELKEGKCSAILTIEDLGPLDGVSDRLETIASWGVAISSLTWNWENVYAHSCSNDKAIMQKGLKQKGFEALEFFKEKGIAVDVSHLSDGGFDDVIASKCKVLATHSNSRAMTDVCRNLTDRQLKALADRGGVAGLNFCPRFLSTFKEGEEPVSRISDMVRHVMHIYKVAGEDILALGTDFDGIGGRLEIPSPDKLYLLWSALSDAGLPERVIDKMKGGNALALL